MDKNSWTPGFREHHPSPQWGGEDGMAGQPMTSNFHRDFGKNYTVFYCFFFQPHFDRKELQEFVVYGILRWWCCSHIPRKRWLRECVSELPSDMLIRDQHLTKFKFANNLRLLYNMFVLKLDIFPGVPFVFCSPKKRLQKNHSFKNRFGTLKHQSIDQNTLKILESK